MALVGYVDVLAGTLGIKEVMSTSTPSTGQTRDGAKRIEQARGAHSALTVRTWISCVAGVSETS